MFIQHTHLSLSLSKVLTKDMVQGWNQDFYFERAETKLSH